MNNKLILLSTFCLLSLITEAKYDSSRRSSWWIAYKLGSTYTNVSEFQRWANSEGLSNISGTSRNTFIGFDIVFNHQRIVYGFNADFELRSLGRTEPYFFSLAFRSGYTLVDENRFQLKSLAGIGLGYAFVRFENGIPVSLQNISPKYTDPFARVSAMVGRLEAISSYSLGANNSNKRFPFQPILFFNAGVQPVLIHGDWNYGEMIDDTIDGSSFVGEKIYMPQFYKANWFVSIGIALSIQNRPISY